MHVATFGTGHVGPLGGACRGEAGHDSPRFDVDQGGIDGRGRSIRPE